MRSLEQEFHDAMRGIYSSAKAECGYNATRFLQMVANEGGLATARKLLAAENLSDGFTALWQCGRLDLTMEHLVLRKRWRGLFNTDELEIARRRLMDVGWDMTAGPTE